MRDGCVMSGVYWSVYSGPHCVGSFIWCIKLSYSAPMSGTGFSYTVSRIFEAHSICYLLSFVSLGRPTKWLSNAVIPIWSGILMCYILLQNLLEKCIVVEKKKKKLLWVKICREKKGYCEWRFAEMTVSINSSRQKWWSNSFWPRSHLQQQMDG